MWRESYRFFCFGQKPILWDKQAERKSPAQVNPEIRREETAHSGEEEGRS